MTRITISILFLIIVIQTVTSQNKGFFPYLSYISIDTTYHVDFGYNPKTSRIVNKPCYLLDKKSPFYYNKDSIDVCPIFVGKFKIDKLKDSLNIIYSDGMSADPCFNFYRQNGTKIGGLACSDLYLNESGTIYTSGHTNSMYNKRRKFQIQNDTILEIQQPYRYVGLKGRILKPITLYLEKTGESIVAKLPENYEIEILLAESSVNDFEVEYNYLVKTEFGLIGWLRITNEDTYGSILKELFYAGD